MKDARTLSSSSTRSTSTHRTVKQKEMTTPNRPLCRRADDATTKSCEHRMLLVCNGTRRPLERGKDEPFEHDKGVGYDFFAAGSTSGLLVTRFLESVRFGRLELLEVCANSDSPLIQAVETPEKKVYRPLSGMVTTSPRDAAANVCICSVQRSDPAQKFPQSRNACLALWMEWLPCLQDCGLLALTFIMSSKSVYTAGNKVQCLTRPKTCWRPLQTASLIVIIMSAC